MSSLPQDTGLSIALWQADADTQKKHDIGVGPIGSLYNPIVELLGLILTSMRTQTSVSRHYQPLESISAALFFWGTDLNVSQGELDEALHDSLQLRDTCLLVLVSIGELIMSCMHSISQLSLLGVANLGQQWFDCSAGKIMKSSPRA